VIHRIDDPEFAVNDPEPVEKNGPATDVFPIHFLLRRKRFPARFFCDLDSDLYPAGLPLAYWADPVFYFYPWLSIVLFQSI
jgi:hypothetical protein